MNLLKFNHLLRMWEFIRFCHVSERSNFALLSSIGHRSILEPLNRVQEMTARWTSRIVKNRGWWRDVPQNTDLKLALQFFILEVADRNKSGNFPISTSLVYTPKHWGNYNSHLICHSFKDCNAAANLRPMWTYQLNPPRIVRALTNSSSENIRICT